MSFPTLLRPLAAALVLAPLASSQVADFDLVRAVPADYFLVTAQRANPEHAFLDEHWAGVWQALHYSGLGEDLMGLLNRQADEQQLAMASGIVGAFGELCRGVSWGELGDMVVFAERMNVPDLTGGGVSIGMPDMLLLLEVDDARADALWAELTGWADGMLGLAGSFAGLQLGLTPGERSGVSTMALDLRTLAPEAPDLSLAFLRHGSVLGVTLGSEVHGEVIDLLTGAEGATSIATTSRFRAAFAALPEPEDGFEYTDMVNLGDSIGGMFEVVRTVLEAELGPAPAGGGEEAGMVSDGAVYAGMATSAMDLVLEAMDLTAYSATVHRTEGHSVHSWSVSALADDAADNRFYPMIGTTRPVGDFTAVLPATTTGYSVSAATDMEATYDFALELMSEVLGPAADELLTRWDALQEGVGFDLRRDVFGWLDGESVSVDFTIDGAPQWVTRVKVKDEAAAGEKLSMVLQLVPALMKEASKQNPALSMLSVLVKPATDPRLEGFSRLVNPVLGLDIQCGVRDGSLVFASSADAIVHCEAVARGEAEGLRSNEVLVGAAVLPGPDSGAIHAASFADHSGTADGIADALQEVGMLGGMMAGMIPDPEGREMVGELLGMVTKLAPVARAFDFYRSSSSLSTFDGKAWRVHSVTHYAGPDPEPATEAVPAAR